MTTQRLPCRAACLLALALAAGAPQQAGAQTLTISAVVLSKNNCTFRGTTPALDFLAINPASSSPATANVTWTLRCNGSSAVATWALSAGDGLHSTGPGARRLRHTVSLTEYMAYTLTVPASGSATKNVDTSFTISGSIAPAAFQNALPGSYSDTVVITLTP